MPNFNKMFQDEVRRLAKKEFKAALDAMRKDLIETRRAVSQLKHKVESLKKENKRGAAKASLPAGETHEGAEDKDRARISSKTIRTMREKLGLTQVEFGKLLNVSGQSVYQWERRDGRLKLRNATRKAVLELKGLGVREARKRLEAMK